MERCLNCGTNAGMGCQSARGYWRSNRYVGGLCPNCVFYPERISSDVLAKIGSV